MARKLVAGIAVAFCLLTQGMATAAQEVRQPAWAELRYEQKQILAPVQGEWDNMPAMQRKRLLGVVKRYPKMKPEEQQRIQRRLKDWSKLTQEERTLARKKYEKLKQLPPEKRLEVQKKWQEYQQLPEEKKELLRYKKAASVKAQSPTVPEPPKPLQETPKSAPSPASAEAAKPAAN